MDHHHNGDIYEEHHALPHGINVKHTHSAIYLTHVIHIGGLMLAMLSYTV